MRVHVLNALFPAANKAIIVLVGVHTIIHEIVSKNKADIELGVYPTCDRHD